MENHHRPRWQQRTLRLAFIALLIFSDTLVAAGDALQVSSAGRIISALQDDATPVPIEPLPQPVEEDQPEAQPTEEGQPGEVEQQPTEEDQPGEVEQQPTEEDTQDSTPVPIAPLPEILPTEDYIQSLPAVPDDEILPSLVATGRCGGNNEYVFDIRNEGNLPVATAWRLYQNGQVIDGGPVNLKPGGAMQVRRFLAGTVTLRLDNYGKPYASSPTVTCNTPECPVYGPFPQTRAWDGGSDVIQLLANGPVRYFVEGKFPPDNNREFLRRSGVLNDGDTLVISYPPADQWGAASPEGMHESHVRVFLTPLNNDQCDTVSQDWDRYWGERPVEPTATPSAPPGEPTATPTRPPTVQPVPPLLTVTATGQPAPTGTPPATSAPTMPPPTPTQTYTPAPTASWAAPLEAEGSVCPDWIVYHTDETGDIEVFRLGPLPAGKTGDVNLTRGVDAVDLGPSLSPDREWIAFASTRDGNWEIYISAVTADDIRRLTFTPDATENSPVWSPDGRYIAFVSDRDGNNELYMIDLSTGEQTRLTDSLYDDRHPFWSPDSRRLVFANDSAGEFQLFELDIQSREVQLRGDTSMLNAVAPAYAFDGRLIAFRSQPTDGQNSVIYVMNADGSNIRQVSDAGGNAGTVSWSPDSTLIAYTSDLDGDLDVYIYDVATQATRLLTDNTVADYAPTWLCDSNTVVFTSDAGETPQIYQSNALPLDAPPIDVLTEAAQLTTSPANNVVPEGMPALRLGL